ncbi:hypothetical protein BH11MYX3_BH11MYX3_39940 [soil metagenome]
MTTHWFRPRYRGVAWTTMGMGGGLGVIGVALGFAAVPLAAGMFGIGLGAAYLTSKTWKLHIVTDDAGLDVRDGKGTRFRLLWTEIVRVVASPTTKTCFIDGGTPEHSVLVPGDGAPAPYSISDRDTLFATILARVAPDRVETVETLDRAPSSQKLA